MPSANTLHVQQQLNRVISQTQRIQTVLVSCLENCESLDEELQDLQAEAQEEGNEAAIQGFNRLVAITDRDHGVFGVNLAGAATDMEQSVMARLEDALRTMPTLEDQVNEMMRQLEQEAPELWQTLGGLLDGGNWDRRGDELVDQESRQEELNEEASDGGSHYHSDDDERLISTAAHRSPFFRRNSDAIPTLHNGNPPPYPSVPQTPAPLHQNNPPAYRLVPPPPPSYNRASQTSYIGPLMLGSDPVGYFNLNSLAT